MLNSTGETATAKQPKADDQTSSASRPQRTKGKTTSSKTSPDSVSAEKSRESNKVSPKDTATSKQITASLKRIPVPNKRNDSRIRDKRTVEARKRLGITSEQMRIVPRISHRLERVEGGIEECINALRLSDDADALRFIEKYDAIATSDRKRLSIEEISTAAGIPVKNLLGSIVLAVEYLGKTESIITTSSYTAPVIRAVGQRAINGPSPTANSKLFLSGSGFLPRPANREPGVFVNITNQNAAAARAMHEASEAPPPPVIEASPSTPYINTEDQLRQLHDVQDGQRLLDAPRDLGEAVEVGGTFVDEELECIPSGDVRD